MNKQVIRYSESFKLKVISEIESGKFNSFKAAKIHYGIAGCGTIQYWSKKYGKSHLLPKIVRVETLNERDQIKALKAEIKQLKNVIADTKVEEVIHKAAFAVVCEEYGLGSVDEVKKKLDASLSKNH